MKQLIVALTMLAGIHAQAGVVTSIDELDDGVCLSWMSDTDFVDTCAYGSPKFVRVSSNKECADKHGGEPREFEQGEYCLID